MNDFMNRVTKRQKHDYCENGPIIAASETQPLSESKPVVKNSYILINFDSYYEILSQ
jgi:hypothetical protein